MSFGAIVFVFGFSVAMISLALGIGLYGRLENAEYLIVIGLLALGLVVWMVKEASRLTKEKQKMEKVV